VVHHLDEGDRDAEGIHDIGEFATDGTASAQIGPDRVRIFDQTGKFAQELRRMGAVHDPVIE